MGECNSQSSKQNYFEDFLTVSHTFVHIISKIEWEGKTDLLKNDHFGAEKLGV